MSLTKLLDNVIIASNMRAGGSPSVFLSGYVIYSIVMSSVSVECIQFIHLLHDQCILE